MSNWVAFFLFFKLLTNLIPTVILFYVIYYIPNKSGKIKKIEIHTEKITLSSSDHLENEEDFAKLKEDDNICLYDDIDKIKSRTTVDEGLYKGINTSFYSQPG